MSLPTIALDDLLIPETDQAAITRALANTGNSDPWTPALVQAVDKVAFYTAEYTLTSATYIRLVRPIVLWLVYGLANSITDAIQKNYDAVIKELEAIRDGKFTKTLAPAAPVPDSVTVRKVSWGSTTKIDIRN